MSLSTRCPACETVFKVVPDQLKVSKGWVRCGRCAEVFDAAAHANTEDNADVSMSAIDNIAKKPINTKTKPIFRPKNTPATDVEPDFPNESASLETDLTFVRVAKNKAFWQQPAVMRTLSAVSLALAALLGIQAVYVLRHHLAALNPVYRSALNDVCQTIGCVLEAHKNIDAFKIDSSSFQKSPKQANDSTQNDVFLLKLTVKNNADIALAMPAIEFTLTDASDKAVLRKVLQTKDFSSSVSTLAGRADWTSTLALTLVPTSTMPAISGYRILLFYP
jgi:predicted Zn finger-like uncharacterized protein